MDKNLVVEQEGLVYSINEDEKTAKFIENQSQKEVLLIPSSINYNSQDYIVTSISNGAFYNDKKLRKIEFADDSKVQKIEKGSISHINIDSISIPSSVIELEEGWCDEYSEIEEIKVMPNNPIFKSYDNKLILKKSNPEKEDHDILVFAVRTILTITIPASIEIISSYSFSNCSRLKQVIFPENSKLRIIEKNAFRDSRITTISIPSSVVELEDGWCQETYNLKQVEVMPNNKYYKIHENQMIVGKSSPEKDDYDLLVFASRDIKNVNIPESIEVIKPYSFHQCYELKSISFPMNSKLRIIESKAFDSCGIKTICFPSNVVQICEDAFYSCEVTEIAFDKNSKLQIIEKYAFRRSSVRKISITSIVVELRDGWCMDARCLSSAFLISF